MASSKLHNDRKEQALTNKAELPTYLWPRPLTGTVKAPQGLFTAPRRLSAL